MREQPKGEELLSCARDFLKEQVLPSVEGDLKHGVLMVMNAMSIAGRQLHNGDAPDQEELSLLRDLLNDPTVGLEEGNQQLADMVRQGAGDPGRPGHDVMYRHLRRIAELKVAESNPKALKG